MSTRVPKKVMDSAIAMYLQHDLAVKDIAELHEIGQNCIYEELKRRGIKANRPRRVRSVDAPPRRVISPEEQTRMRDMRKAGMSAPVIAAILKTSPASVRKHWIEPPAQTWDDLPLGKTVWNERGASELPIQMIEPTPGLFKRLYRWLFG